MYETEGKGGWGREEREEDEVRAFAEVGWSVQTSVSSGSAFFSVFYLRIFYIHLSSYTEVQDTQLMPYRKILQVYGFRKSLPRDAKH